MKRILLFILCLFLTANIMQAQDLKAYQIYNKKGEPVTFTQMISKLAGYDVVLFGEYHNNSINHWLELKTTEALYGKVENNLILGAEMFERDDQHIVNRYLADDIDSGQFIAEAHPWKNFKTDYKPLLDFAKTHQLQFIATNVPRMYASLVVDKGLDTLLKLPEAEQRYMAQLPVEVTLETPGYKEMETMMKKHAGANAMKYIYAQALKDATMAQSIANSRKPEQLFLHYNGNFHSKEHGGIYWYLKKLNKGLQIAVINVAESDSLNLPFPDDIIPTEFNIIIPKDMAKTYL